MGVMIIGWIVKHRKHIYGLLIIPVLLAASQIVAGEQRVAIDVADVTASPDDTLIAVPVYISFPLDSLAGIEVYFRIDENPHLKFASDDVRDDGLVMAADTAGSFMSGWELVTVSNPDNTMYDLKYSGMAFWINDGTTPAAAPRDSALLTTLYFRLENRRSLLPDDRFEIRIDPAGSGFSDPVGNSIGVVTTHERRCAQYVNDSCVSWKVARVGKMDTTLVGFHGGSVRIVSGSLPEPEKTDAEP